MHRPTLEEVLGAVLSDQDGARTLPERFSATCLSCVEVTAVALAVTGPGGRHLLLVSSDSLAGQLDELESTLGEGPGVDANRTGGPVLVADLRDREHAARWPAYTAAASETPVRSQFAFPLQIGAIRLGVLSLYRDWSAPLSEQDLTNALVLADAATVLVLHLQDISGTGAELHHDVSSSFVATAELHQATGMISVQAAVGMAEALLLLHARAFSTSRTSLAVARDVLAGTLNFRRKGNMMGMHENRGGVGT